MSISMIKSHIDEIHREYEHIRETQGEEAAHKYSCSQTGAAMGMLGGAATGAAIGSVIPVVGTFVGMFIGGIWGAVQGGKDESRVDNIKTVGKGVSGFMGWFDKL